MQPRDILFAGVKRAGILGAVRDSEWRRRRLLILCYHGVSTLDEHEWNSGLYVPPHHLRHRLQFLRQNGYTILPLTEACRMLKSGTLPSRSVALTFDDGALDFASVALPILKEFHAPATVYLTTYYSDVRLPVFDVVLSYVLWRGRHKRVDLSSLCESSEPLWAQTPVERAHAGDTLYQYAITRRLDAHAKNALVAAVADLVGISYEAILESGVLQIMAPDVVATLPRDLIDVQLHTHRHRTPRARDLFMRELHDNATHIRALRGEDVPLAHFCYPSGDYDGAFLSWLREAGIQYATTCIPGLASAKDHPLLLPRLIDTAARSELEFEAWASGFAALLPKRPAYRIDHQRLESA